MEMVNIWHLEQNNNEKIFYKTFLRAFLKEQGMIIGQWTVSQIVFLI